MSDQRGSLIDQQFGNYRIMRLLGQGGFADVYLGEHVHLGTQAAIKVLYARLGNDDREKFLVEARTIAHLAHPNIVQVLDFGVENGTPFLVMGYGPGVACARSIAKKCAWMPLLSLLTSGRSRGLYNMLIIGTLSM